MNLKDKLSKVNAALENEVKKRAFLENELQNVSANILELKGKRELLEELIAEKENATDKTENTDNEENIS